MLQTSPAASLRVETRVAAHPAQWSSGTHPPSAMVGPGSQEMLLEITNPLAGGSEVEGPYRVVEARVAKAGEVPQVTGMTAGAPVIWLHRVKLSSGHRPVSVDLQIVSLRHVPRLLEQPLEELSILTYLRQQHVPVARTRTYIEPAVLTAKLADQLQGKPGQAVLRLRRLSWLSSGELIEVVTSTFGTTDGRLCNEHILPSSDWVLPTDQQA